MKGKKYLAKNISIMTISQFGSKILSFLLVPLYTSILSTGEYGTYDLINSTISLLIPILTLCVSDAVLRFPLDEENDKIGIFTVAIKRYLISQLLISLPIIFNCFITFNLTIKIYSVYIILMYASHTLSGIVINFARGLDGIKEVGISGVICSVVMLGLNILFLVVFKIGLDGYFIANITALFVQMLYLFVSLKLWDYLCFKGKYYELQKKMFNYSSPLIANSIAWWVNNVSDRYVVTWICGVAANGIYSVAYKIPSIISAMQGIFNQAWTLSAVKDFDSSDSKGFFGEIYNTYNFLMIIICSILIMFTKIIANIMYSKEFYEAWRYVPWLLISVVFGAMSGYLGGVFAAVKNTKVFSQTTVVSAVVNTILNVVLVNYIGPLGAAIATLISYYIVFFIRIKYVKRYINFKLNLFRDHFCYLVLIAQSLLLYVFSNSTIYYYMIEMVLLIVILLLYIKELNHIKRRVLRRMMKK